MTPGERAAARKRCEQATKGPWCACTGSGHNECTAVHSDAQDGIICDLLPDYEFRRDPAKPILQNLRFIEHARTDLPKALDQIDSDERLMEQVLESHDHFPHGVGAATDALRTRLGEERGRT